MTGREKENSRRKGKTGLPPQTLHKPKNPRADGQKGESIKELANIPEDEIIFIQNADGTPLAPTRRHRHIQRLLDRGKAKLISSRPWIVRLKYQVENPVAPSYAGSTDPGRTNIGEALIDVAAGEVIFLTKVETRNKDIPDLMNERREHRQASRRGERLRRKRRSHKLGQVNHELEANGGRKLVSCDEIVPVKDIINTEARFENRKRPEGWLTPTARQLVETHLNMVDKMRQLVPVTDWCLEINKFAFMKLDDGTIYGVDYQNGQMKGFDSVEDYVYARQGGKCGMPGCQNEIKHCHHVVSRREGGSDLPDNRIGLCKECHDRVHTGKATIPVDGFKKQYGALSVLNQAIPYIYAGLVARFGEDHVHLCSGYETSVMRKELDLAKDHHLDAVAIYAACMGDASLNVDDLPDCHTVRQFRRHNRQRINNQRERTYKLEGVIVAKNRKPRFEQSKDYPALSEAKLTEKQVSRLSVSPSHRYYNSRDRIMPGALFLVDGRVCVLTGQQHYGEYLLFKYDIVDDKNKPIAKRAKECKLLKKNVGLVFVS